MQRISSVAIVIIVFAGLVHGAPGAYAAETDYVVSGTVLGDSGEPAPKTYVDIWVTSAEGASFADKALVDPDGTFSLRVPAGKGHLSAYSDEWRTSTSQEVSITGDTTGIRLILATPPPKTATVSGIVTDLSGNPIEGATVTIGQGCCYAMPAVEPAPATPPSEGSGVSSSDAVAPTESRMAYPYYYHGDHEEATTGADGKFSFTTYAGFRQVTAWAKGYAQTTLNVEAKADESVRADLKLEKVPDANAVVRGKVVDAKTGAPISGAGVSVSNVEWGRYEYATSAADGSFELKTLPGWTQITVYYYGDHGNVAYASDSASGEAKPAIAPMPVPSGPQKQYYQYIQTLRLKAGDNNVDVRLEPKPEATIVLIGYVVDPDANKGVANANVNVWNQDTGDWGNAVTDQTGSYKLLVRPGHYTMNVWAEDHLPGAAMFVVSEDAKTVRFDIEAPAGTQKYAPCDDCDPHPMPMYAERAETTEPGIASYDAGSEASKSYSTPGAPSSATSDGATTTKAEGPSTTDSTRAATLQGSGGGLPEYDPNKKTDSTLGGATTADPPRAPTPGLGLVAVLGLLGLAALALRRRAG